ncbi:MAG TPA: protein-glutamate O-methyltransferase CheR [Pantanalinema sp.]
MTTLSDREFADIQALLYREAGIKLAPGKKPMVSGRLSKRVAALGLPTYGAYYERIAHGRDPAELQRALDLLTTNETYFFREPKHFEFLRDQALAKRGAGPMRVWSAASSSGEEAYSVAMVLAATLGDSPWEVVGTDISARVLEQAVSGRYPMARTQGIPAEYLKRYCLKGVRSQEGHLLVDRSLRERVAFKLANLVEPQAQLGLFDVIFLRNVMIYFDQAIKQQVVANLLPRLKPGGYLFVGHSESLNGVSDALASVRPAIYRKE